MRERSQVREEAQAYIRRIAPDSFASLARVMLGRKRNDGYVSRLYG